MRSLPQNLPKITALPHPQTEATILLALHKLVSEKNRLRQELIRLEARQADIHDRLAAIAAEREQLEQSRKAMRTRAIAHALDVAFLEDETVLPHLPDTQ